MGEGPTLATDDSVTSVIKHLCLSLSFSELLI